MSYKIKTWVNTWDVAFQWEKAEACSIIQINTTFPISF